MPNNNLTGPRVVALVYDGLCLFEFSIAAETFGLPRPEFGHDWYRFASCAIEPGPLFAQGGMQVSASHDGCILDTADIIIIPGWRGIDASVPEHILSRLKAAHGRGARLVSICSGAFVLAAAGLLDGKSATTHWRYADQLQESYPKILVDADVLYIDEGSILTSAGSSAGIDLMLHIVRTDYGNEMANAVARRLVIPAHRSGGQAQFIERPMPRQNQGRLSPLLDMMRSNLAEDWPITKMADGAAMSKRTFIRNFVKMTGIAPGKWLIAERLEAAKNLLVGGNDSIDDIAFRVGLGSGDTLRHHFAKHFQISPGQYRDRFQDSDGL